MEPAYLTVKSLAEYLGVTEKYIRTLTHSGKLTYHKAFGKNLYSKAYIDRIMQDSIVLSVEDTISGTKQ